VTAASHTLPAPAPGPAQLVFLHLRLLVREFPLAWALFGVVALVLPMTALLAPVGAGPEATEPSDLGFSLFLTVRILSYSAASLAVIVALLWPDAVWRRLPPGERDFVDAMPVDRRLHRSARMVAGAALPLAFFAILWSTHFFLDLRGSGVFSGDLAALTPSLSLAHGIPGILAAYALGSALALRLGKVFIPILVGAALFWALSFALVMAGQGQATQTLAEWIFTGEWAPVRSFASGLGTTHAPMAATLLWLAVFGGLAVALAGQHDRK
jgi:hypothetical protein